jgi:enoyl-CoA hydratase/carnithine racemase
LPGGVTLVVDGPVASVWLDRPEVRNAQTFATWSSLAEVPGLLPADVRVVLLRSTGPDFSAGLDLRQLRPGGTAEGSVDALLPGSDAQLADAIATFQQAFTPWRELTAVVVAVVQGRAIGAGLQLALAADLRVAAADAQLVVAESRLGLVPDLGGTAALVELVGYSRALELCLLGRPVAAPEALAWGLVNRVAGEEGLDGAVDALAAGLLALPAPVLRATKRLVAGAVDRTGAEQRLAERTTQVPLLRAAAGGVSPGA